MIKNLLKQLWRETQEPIDLRSQIQVLNNDVKEELLILLNNPRYAPMDKNALRIENEMKKAQLLEVNNANLVKIETDTNSRPESLNSADIEQQKRKLLEAQLNRKGEFVLKQIQESKPDFDSEQVQLIILGIIQESLENGKELETVEWLARLVLSFCSGRKIRDYYFSSTGCSRKFLNLAELFKFLVFFFFFRRALTLDRCLC